MLWKGAFDVVASALGLLMLAPLLLFIALLILILDGRPVLFSQERLGQNKRTFRIWKFRTLHNGVVTRAGAVLRQTGLDELPQIINILSGQMSVVGPRPLINADVFRLGWDDEYHAVRWELKPGITGLAQLYGGRGAKVSWRLDKVYRERVSLWFDLWIILMSIVVNVVGKRRVRQFLR